MGRQRVAGESSRAVTFSFPVSIFDSGEKPLRARGSASRADVARHNDEKMGVALKVAAGRIGVQYRAQSAPAGKR